MLLPARSCNDGLGCLAARQFGAWPAKLFVPGDVLLHDGCAALIFDLLQTIQNDGRILRSLLRQTAD